MDLTPEMPFLRGFPGVFYMPWLVCGLAALTPFWAILGHPGPSGHEKRTPTAADAHDLKIVDKLRAVPASNVAVSR